ncbi:unnamed protein product [Phyllotreta striolata]|uniref:SET domain-containing protein n=1 Tax=Phyllotreta striolata TaxID=444603 RepID=A0A9N9THD9_PHYSR|nr:unnamed protein product [Phyllotreta striolata]
MDLFEVRKNDKVGRYAVAKKDLKASDVILTETPFVYGPKSDSPVVCLGCYNFLETLNVCSKCSWPVCNSECESQSTHKDFECETFSKAGVKFQIVDDLSEVNLQYECITPLRLLLAKEKNPTRWKEEIEHMEAHNDIRKQRPIWNFNQHNVVEYLRSACKLDRFPEELIHTACGILEINAFEARTPEGNAIRCLFPKLAILSHSCVSNIHHAIDGKGNGNVDDFSVTVRAAVDVPAGGELHSSYTYSLWPTLVRREFLRESKYFECTCSRCRDKTELGTHCGTLKCQRCDNGVILSTNPLDDQCEWKCTHCEYKTNAVAVRKVFAAIQEDLDQVEYVFGAEGIESRETLYKKYKSVLHPKNSYMTILRSALVQLYGKADGYTLDDLPDLILERKVELCNQLLEVLDVIEPGYSRIRGVIFFELHGPLMVLTRHQYQNEVISKEKFKEELRKTIDILGKSVRILKQESSSLPEGQLAIVAEQAYEQLNNNFDVLVETA